jgi:hypothetical protein
MNFEDIKKQIEKAPLEKVEPTKEDRRSISNKLDFSKYKFNNWKIKDDNETLNQIFSKSGGI